MRNAIVAVLMLAVCIVFGMGCKAEEGAASSEQPADAKAKMADNMKAAQSEAGGGGPQGQKK